MNIIFVGNLIFSFLLISKFINVHGKSSCENSIPDPTFGPLLPSPGQHFSVLFYKSLAGRSEEGNVFISPFSLLMALGMTTEGGDENKFMKLTSDILQIDGSISLTQDKLAFQQYLRSLCPNDKFTLSMANRIYVQNNFPLERTFTEKLQTFFLSGEAEEVNFWDNPLSASMYINEWIEQQSLSTIKDLISVDALDDTVLFLINSIYFSGKWELPFDSALTRLEPFNLANNETIRVPTMFIQNRFKYAFNHLLNSQILQLNYDGGRLAMYIILPERGTKLTDIHEQLYSDVIDRMRNVSAQLVEVSLPKFKASFTENSDTPSLIFHLQGKLSRMTTNSTMKAYKVAHQAFVDFDEERSTASTGTAFLFNLLGPFMYYPPRHQRPVLHPSPPPPSSSPIRFKVDRPCFYLICDIKFRQILFMGNLDNPSFYKQP